MSPTPNSRRNQEIKSPECFVMMPIAECDGYPSEHFKHVFEDIIRPACETAGFSATRADQVKQSNLIHLDILQSLLDAPMAICDLSTRNPNVLFELALRQAFDKPVCLIQEVGTPPIFDISPLRYVNYRRERVYHEVLEDQNRISASIKATFDDHSNGKGIQSIIKLLALSNPASLPQMTASDANSEYQHLILNSLDTLRTEIQDIRRIIHRSSERPPSRINLFAEVEEDIAFIERAMVTGEWDASAEKFSKVLHGMNEKIDNAPLSSNIEYGHAMKLRSRIIQLMETCAAKIQQLNKKSE